MKFGPVLVITGPPGAGKTTLCEALAPCFERTIHIPVDDLRTWVVSGLSESVNWTDETERQFQLAEAAASATAKTYSEAGFAVLIDHCRNLPRLDEVVENHLRGLPVLKVCLLPTQEITLERNRTRTNKDFDTVVLEPIIHSVTERYVADKGRQGWLVIDNSTQPLSETAAIVHEQACELF
ncbi:MAG: AAA family ATPase [Armatimonadetes bacterium]|nr:AAA family ATPase [Armatimonadota bacterium]